MMANTLFESLDHCKSFRRRGPQTVLLKILTNDDVANKDNAVNVHVVEMLIIMWMMMLTLFMMAIRHLEKASHKMLLSYTQSE